MGVQAKHKTPDDSRSSGSVFGSGLDLALGSDLGLAGSGSGSVSLGTMTDLYQKLNVRALERIRISRCAVEWQKG